MSVFFRPKSTTNRGWCLLETVIPHSSCSTNKLWISKESSRYGRSRLIVKLRRRQIKVLPRMWTIRVMSTLPNSFIMNSARSSKSSWRSKEMFKVRQLMDKLTDKYTWLMSWRSCTLFQLISFVRLEANCGLYWKFRAWTYSLEPTVVQLLIMKTLNLMIKPGWDLLMKFQLRILRRISLKSVALLWT